LGILSAREILYADLGFGDEILEETYDAGLDPALGAAIVEKESNGRNIFGHDHAWAITIGDQPPYYGHAVTKARVQLLLDSQWENGVGITQLTYTPFVQQAMAMGGAHIPRYQCRVAFRLMSEMLSKYSYPKALASYNAGETNWMNGIDNGYAQDLGERHERWKAKLAGEDPTPGGGNVVTGLEIVKSAYKLDGVQYRLWQLGDPLPMWVKDGYSAFVAPPVDHMKRVKIMCSDFVSWALCDNGLPPCYGTEALASYLVGQLPFDPETPGVPGAICLKPYSGPALADQGHVGIYVDEHTIIQALFTSGVTDAYTDAETWSWGGATEFTTYGFLPGVTYDGTVTPDPGGGGDESTWEEYGWYEYESADSWNLRYREPTS
jgi:hypothetical protein